MRDFNKLAVWRKAHALTLAVYRASHSFPKEEQYGLTSQARRAAASIPANIAEGCGRSGDAELARFVTIAAGSASELQYHLLLATDLGYIAADIYQPLHQQVIEVKRMLNGLHRSLKAAS